MGYRSRLLGQVGIGFGVVEVEVIDGCIGLGLSHLVAVVAEEEVSGPASTLAAVEFARKGQFDAVVEHFAIVDAAGAEAKPFGRHAHGVGQQIGTLLIVKVKVHIE